MLAALIAAQLTTMARAHVEYVDLPAQVAAASVFDFREGAVPVRSGTPAIVVDGRIRLEHESGSTVIVLLTREDGAYVLDGPFAWPSVDQPRRVEVRWRRTLAGAGASGLPSGVPLEWIASSAGAAEPWPRCFRGDAQGWACWGVAVNAEAGVIVARGADVWWTIVTAAGARQWRHSEWARLIVATASGNVPPSRLHVTLANAVAAGQRFRNTRLETAAVANTDVMPVTTASVWVAGGRPPPLAWAEVRAADSAPQYIPLEELAGGPSSVPVRIALEPERRLDGHVSGGVQHARGALVTLYRLVDPPPQPNDRVKPRRVSIGETTTDESGEFHFDGLGDANYEVVAWHPQLGRASALIAPTQSTVNVRLDAAGMVRGRVLVSGKPAAGIDVFSVPDAAAFTAADDPIEVKGGDGRTGADGRFAVTLAPAGGGELRIGGGRFAVKRIPLPRQPVPLVDLGDIDLASAISLAIVLDQDAPCELHAVGPVGRLGLHIVTATRTGPGLYRLDVPEEGSWQVGLECSGTTRGLVPASIQVTGAMNGKEVRLVVR